MPERKTRVADRHEYYSQHCAIDTLYAHTREPQSVSLAGDWEFERRFLGSVLPIHEEKIKFFEVFDVVQLSQEQVLSELHTFASGQNIAASQVYHRLEEMKAHHDLPLIQLLGEHQIQDLIEVVNYNDIIARTKLDHPVADFVAGKSAWSIKRAAKKDGSGWSFHLVTHSLDNTHRMIDLDLVNKSLVQDFIVAQHKDQLKLTALYAIWEHLTVHEQIESMEISSWVSELIDSKQLDQDLDALSKLAETYANRPSSVSLYRDKVLKLLTQLDHAYAGNKGIEHIGRCPSESVEVQTFFRNLKKVVDRLHELRLRIQYGSLKSPENELDEIPLSALKVSVKDERIKLLHIQFGAESLLEFIEETNMFAFAARNSENQDYFLDYIYLLSIMKKAGSRYFRDMAHVADRLELESFDKRVLQASAELLKSDHKAVNVKSFVDGFAFEFPETREFLKVTMYQLMYLDVETREARMTVLINELRNETMARLEKAEQARATIDERVLGMDEYIEEQDIDKNLIELGAQLTLSQPDSDTQWFSLFFKLVRDKKKLNIDFKNPVVKRFITELYPQFPDLAYALLEK